jgi:hypothetical protein
MHTDYKLDTAENKPTYRNKCGFENAQSDKALREHVLHQTVQKVVTAALRVQ